MAKRIPSRPAGKKLLIVPLMLIASFMTCAQTDDAGAGRAMLFDGVDDYIDLGNIYDNVALPITISAWVFVEAQADVRQYPVFTSQDNTNIYNGFTLVTSTLPHIGFTIGDGRGGNNPAYRKSRAGYYETMGEWVYITAVAKSGSDMHTYMNGHDVSAEYQGSSSYPMNSLSPNEVAKIGYYFANDITFWFKGLMDEVRIWDRALSINEIRQTMCKRLRGDEANLIGYWNFDETGGDVLKDLSSNGFHGTLRGNPVRVFSGAPVGDESAWLYSGNWAGVSLSKGNLSVDNISGTPFGVHIYTVNSVPSQTGGLNASDIQLPYYGVFLADDGGNNTFDLSFVENNVCTSFQRQDNSEPSWAETNTLAGIAGRVELIPAFQTGGVEVDLGEDTLLCDKNSFLLEAAADPAGKTFLWNNGETTHNITVISSGTYAVEMRHECEVSRDTIKITLANTPPAFSLGEDEILCLLEQRTLKPSVETTGFDFTWHDGSTEHSFLAEAFGTYWLKLQNACGASIDSITFSRKVYTDIQQYNFISPDNTDDWNQFFMLDEKLRGSQLAVFNRWGKQVYQSGSYQNNWDGGGLPSGVYFYKVNGECIEPLKGTITIMR